MAVTPLDPFADRVARAAHQRPVPHPSVAERTARGRDARARTPRSALATWTTSPERPDPIALLTGQETSRVPELVPVRHARMASSPFAFYRGSAIIMAADLGSMPRTDLEVQLCGDAHLANFGLFASPDRSLVFDVNDFDETHPGPFEWDVARLATSFVLAARDNSLATATGAEAARIAAATYRTAMATFATKRELDIWYDRIDVTSIQAQLPAYEKSARRSERRKVRRLQTTLGKTIAAAQARDAWSAIAKITEVVDGRRQFRNEPPLLARLDTDAEMRRVVNVLFHDYRATLQDDRRDLLKRYEVIDAGHKVVGVGSVGLLALVLLMRGRDDDDLMILQVKQAQASVLEPYTKPSAFTRHGHRVVSGQRLMQAASDSFLGWIDGPNDHSFYVRQLRDMKWAPDPSKMRSAQLREYAAACGHTLARAHARSGDAVAIAAYLGTGERFDASIQSFSVAYADQVEQDYADFTGAIADGRLSAQAGGGAAARRASDPSVP